MSKKYIEPGDAVSDNKNVGSFYVIAMGVIHMETKEEMIICQDYKSESNTWAIPKSVFEEKYNGEPRFEYLYHFESVKPQLASRQELREEAQRLRSEQLEAEKAIFAIKRKLSDIDWLMHQY